MTDATDLCRFIDAAPHPAFAVQALAARLTAAGFAEVDFAGAAWPAGAGAWFVRREGALIAWRGRGPRLRRFALIGAHTDSPNLRLKPRPAYANEGCLQFAVEVYGGALWNSWLDRDLGLAGTVHSEDGGRHLIDLRRPLARVAQLAIHLDRKVNDEGLRLNPQLHLAPLWGLARGDAAAAFAALLAEASGVPAAAIVAHDLALYDLCPSSAGGVDGGLLFAPRLDNLASCHAGLRALIDARDGEADVVPVLAAFDHEEIGSASVSGAEGPLLASTLERIALAAGLDRGAWLGALAASTMLSADMAHAVHPNYVDRHEPRHRPRLGDGPVLKTNVNQRYATSAATAAHVQRLARRAQVPLQDFVARSDIGCGSTIGPAVATGLGIAVADVGAPMLSMHSARECAAVADQAMYARLLTEHLRS